MYIYIYIYIYVFSYQDIAVIVFQAMCHVLKNCVPDACSETLDSMTNATHLENGPRKQVYKIPLEGDPIVDHPTLLSSLLNGLAVMTEKFKLKWQECVETICLLSLAQEILNHPGTLPIVSLDIFIIRWFIIRAL